MRRIILAAFVLLLALCTTSDGQQRDPTDQEAVDVNYSLFRPVQVEGATRLERAPRAAPALPSSLVATARLEAATARLQAARADVAGAARVGDNARLQAATEAAAAAVAEVEDAVRFQALTDTQPVTPSTQQDPSGNAAAGIEDIAHQPLIHVKVRVIEVNRSNELAVSSVLDYISSTGTASKFKGTSLAGTNINSSNQRTSGATNFSFPGLIGLGEATAGVAPLNAGSGMLVNLTAERINWLASFLATEFRGDMITAPQVTTLNGKNVTFRAGSKIPFALGQNSVTGTTNNIQQYFYKHVGAFVSVTPQIVNWGPDAKGLGGVRENYATRKDLAKVPVPNGDVRDLRTVLDRFITDRRLRTKDNETFRTGEAQDIRRKIDNKTVTPDELGKCLETTAVHLNRLLDVGLTRFDLATITSGAVAPPYKPGGPNCQGCTWQPSECTINLNISVRLSDLGTSPSEVIDSSGRVVDAKLTSENNVRAISNIVQVKSGHGVVIGGLISMRENEQASKVPLLGDLPVVGAAFRSKHTERGKVETLIFVEAEVLPSFEEECSDECGSLAKAKTAQDFCDGKYHLECDLCAGHLSEGLRRAGVGGEYLPPPTAGEKEYCRAYHEQTCHQRNRTMAAQARDIFGK